ncbi:MAG TPA: GNAT family N-acetyltransferase [Pseudonocardiaceae bacterium]|nr:GNAT family N-acetyltransferase [Pseudonocardiaceae bacterium]
MHDSIVELTDQPDDADLAVLSAGLDEFNRQATGMLDRRSLAVFVKDPSTGQVVGGLSGRTSYGLLFVDYFYLPPELRGAGLGRELLRQAEDEAVRRGCRAGMLYTINFQAPEFYRRNGWRVFGAVPAETDGVSRIFLTKALAAGPSAATNPPVSR